MYPYSNKSRHNINCRQNNWRFDKLEFFDIFTNQPKCCAPKLNADDISVPPQIGSISNRHIYTMRPDESPRTIRYDASMARRLAVVADAAESPEI